MKVVETEDLNDADSEACECADLTDRLTYIVISEMTQSRILGEYRSYGIAVTNETGETVRTVHDITCDRAALEKLVLLCNRLELALCHLDDVIDDFLC